jgi:hypothetical protein
MVVCLSKSQPVRGWIYGALFSFGFLLATIPMWADAAPKTAVLINLAPEDAPILTAALQAQGFQTSPYDPSADSFSADLVVLECQGGHQDVSQKTADALGKYVQNGGSLLMGLPLDTGITPIRLSFLSPTMGWMTRLTTNRRGGSYGAINSGWEDPDFFKTGSAFSLPYYFSIRPFHAVERGIARYDQLNKANAWLNTPHAAGDFFWTRPLLNRDWKVRIQGDDRGGAPLLITGLYGAGRVAVFASSLTSSDAGLAPIWKSLLAWLTEAPPKAGADSSLEPVEISTTVVPRDATPGSGALRVTLKSAVNSPLSVQVVARILTWEQAIVGDQTKVVQIPAGQEVTVDLPLPTPGPTQYQALDARDAFVVRVGVLSSTGATLLAEKVVPVDFAPTTGLTVSTDNIDQIPFPYPEAPDPTTGNMSSHGGMPVMAYAYPPGSTVNATVVVSNGLRNLAPLAQVKDETTADNPSTYALTDGAANYGAKPRDTNQAYGQWTGVKGVENVLSFHFATPVSVAGVTLMGKGIDHRDNLFHNPGAVVIECDGKQVASDTALDDKFKAENGLVRISFPPVMASDVRIHLPWVDMVGDKPRQEPVLGEIGIEAAMPPLPQPLNGEASLILRDSLSGTESVIAKKTLTVVPGTREEWVVPVPLPASDTRYYQLEARFGTEHKKVPVLAIAPKKTVVALDQLRPPTAPGMGFIVTSGFRNGFDTAVGTREAKSAWEEPDDLVWAYSRNLKQTTAVSPTKADWLYLTTSNLAHYSTPWTVFPNGESVFDVMTPTFIERMEKDKKWADAKKAVMFFSDRWDSGPCMGNMYTWQDYVAFDDYLRSKGGQGLKGRTRADIAAEIQSTYYPQWCQWQEARYVQNVQNLSKAFADQGKELTIGAQGIPLMANADVKIVSKTFQGMGLDNTWGMSQESIPFTTGQQMAILALNPDLKLGLNLVWGWDSNVLGNLAFYAVVGTTEPSRRHYDDVAWRGLVDSDGNYKIQTTYGFGANGSVSYVMAPNDWQENWNAIQRYSLIYPEAPLGAGLIVSSSIVDSPGSVAFSGGGMGGSPSEAMTDHIAQLFERLHNAGLSIPFSSNINTVAKWSGNAPLIVQDLSTVTPEEAQELDAMGKRGIKIAAFAGSQPPVPAVAALFGLDANGAAATAKPAGTAAGVTLLAQGNFLYIPLQAINLTSPGAQQLAPILQKWLDLPITYPEGTMGYGFTSGKQEFIEVEDYLEKGRTVTLRVKATSDSVHAIELNDHEPLTVTRDGTDWLIQLPLRPGDGDVVVLEKP